MAITATGLGSGLDIESIITGLMAIEKRPLEVLEGKQSQVSSKISAMGTLSSAVSSFQTSMTALKTVDAFEIYTASSSDDTVFTATATSSAVAGSYVIDNSQVGHQLATANKKQSAAFATAATSTAAAGTMKIEFGATAESFSVAITGLNDTLEGIRDAINDATDNIGVTATIITVDAGAKLVLTSDDTGTNGAITLSDTSGNVASTLATTDITVAQNAIFTIDSNTVTSQSNTVEDAIQGVTIDLLTVGTTSETLTIANDITSVNTAVQGFVDAYNSLTSTLKTLRGGDLQGDNSLLTMESQLRSVFNTTPTGLSTSLKYLSEIGITTTDSGDLTLDAADLETQLKLDFGGIAELLADNAQGYVYRLEALADDFLDSDGLIDSRTDTLNTQKDNLADDKLNIEYRLELIEQRYRSQFTALDELLSSLNSTSSFLTQQLSSLPGAKKAS